MDAPKLGLVTPSDGSGEDLVEITLIHPIVWKNSPPILCMATETVTDLSNSALICNHPSRKNKLDAHTEAVVIPNSRPLQTDLEGLIRNPYLRCSNKNPMAYTDVFVDEFWGLDKRPVHRRHHIRRTLFHAPEKVF